MNIVFPYRSEPLNGLELKYALRSIDKYLSGYGKVFIIGDTFPNWLTNVIPVTHYEESIKTSRNILNKMLCAFGMMEKFIQWQDDIFLTKPLKVSEIKYWYDGSLENAIFKHHGGYKQLIINTALKVTEATKYYDVHTPIIYQKDVFELMCNRYNWNEKGFLVKTLYCHTGMVMSDPINDCKIPGPVDDIKKRVGDSLFFSTSPQAICPEMEAYFESLYPEKSRFEK